MKETPVRLDHAKIVKCWIGDIQPPTLFVSVNFGSDAAADFDRAALNEIEKLATAYVNLNREKSRRCKKPSMLEAYSIKFTDDRLMRVKFVVLTDPD